MKKLILVRHGKTANNAARLLQGQQDVPLSEVGVLQAQSLAQALSKEHIDLIVSSPLIRALKTAEIVNDGRDIPVTVSDDLRERSFGMLQGMPIKSYQDLLAASGATRHEYVPPGGESILEVGRRCQRAYEATSRSCAETILISAHEGVNKCLILMLLERPYADWVNVKQENCCINEFHFDAQGRVRSYSLNASDHLPMLSA